MTLIQEMELLLNERGMSPEDASKIIGCSVGQVYKWLREEVRPGSLSIMALRQALPKIRRIPIVEFVGLDRDRFIFRKLAKAITPEERRWLLSSSGGGYDVYRQRLDELAGKYGIAKEGDPCKK